MAVSGVVVLIIEVLQSLLQSVKTAILKPPCFKAKGSLSKHLSKVAHLYWYVPDSPKFLITSFTQRNVNLMFKNASIKNECACAILN